MISTEKQKFQNNTFELISAIENIESTVSRKNKDSFNVDDELSKKSSFILHFQEGKINNLSIQQHRQFKNKYLLEYTTIDPLE
jgi:hypothetical protein